MKKLVASFLVAIVVLSGCISESEEYVESIEFTVLYNNVEDKPFKEDWLILEEYLTRKNVEIDVIIGDNANFEQSIRLSLFADNQPDIILKCWPDTIDEYVNDGLLLAINDYEYLLPYYTAYIEENALEDEIDKLRADNGKYYLLPGFSSGMQAQQWIYREDLFENNGLDMPTTYEELFECLIVLKKKYPETTPITASWGGAHLLSMIGAGYGIPAGWSGVRYYDSVKNKWLFAPATDNYREMLRFLNRCYEANLLDSELFTQSNDEFIEKVINGKALVTVTWISSGFSIWNEALADNGYPEGVWLPLPVMESTIGITGLPSVDKFNKGIAITSGAVEKPYFEDMMKFLDWAIYSDEGISLSYWGVEGVTYEESEEGKIFLPNIISPNNPEGALDIHKDYGLNTFFNLNEDKEYENDKMPDYIVDFLIESEMNNETLLLNPRLNLSAAEMEMEEITFQALLPYVDECTIKFVTGEMDIEDDWDEYIDRIDNLGYKMIEILWNNAWIG